MTDSPRTSATRLAVAVDRLRTRLREEATSPEPGLTLSSVAMLHRLAERGPMSGADLAAAEHVSQQAITQRLALLAPTGYVALAPDPGDRRRKLVTLTDAGRAKLDEVAHGGDDWLARAIEAVVADDERATLDAAVGLLDRLAAAEVDARGGRR